MLKANQVYLGDCTELLRKVDDESVDLVVTSPPYDHLRSYEGTLKWGDSVWQSILFELYRVSKQGGLVVWIVGDAVVKAKGETGTSFRQALFAKEAGFLLHDTMIWQKSDYTPLNHNRYEQCFEYMFVFSKGRPKTFNPIKVLCVSAGSTYNHARRGKQKEETQAMRRRPELRAVKHTKIKANLWLGKKSQYNSIHPATFPLWLVKDHILSWSNEGELILDPFMGSGTTAIACLETKRKFIGMEVNPDYHHLSLHRIQEAIHA